MKLSIISFTRRGSLLAVRLGVLLREAAYDCDTFLPDRFFAEAEAPDGGPQGSGRNMEIFPLMGEKAKDWAGRMFSRGRSMIFIGAAGIAVRAAAPWLKDKFEDPAMVVMDEAGRFAIPILSGHAGGANGLARVIGDLTGAMPVITTATDVNRLFSVDEFAARNGLTISSRLQAKNIAMALLEGEPVGFFSDFPVCGSEKDGKWIPPGCSAENQQRNIRITVRQRGDGWQKEDLILTPRALVLGVGCRREIEREKLETEIMAALAEENLRPEAVKALATIDLKADERAILELSERWGWKVISFSAEDLRRVPGRFSSSPFVLQTVGVDNVCERAACAGAPEGVLVMRKRAGGGVTVAAVLEHVEIGWTREDST